MSKSPVRVANGGSQVTLRGAKEKMTKRKKKGIFCVLLGLDLHAELLGMYSVLRAFLY